MNEVNDSLNILNPDELLSPKEASDDFRFEMRHIEEGKTILFEAPQRQGKTLGMSILAYDEYRNHKRQIYSNIEYSFPWKPLNFFELELSKMDDLLESVMTIDELNFYLDNRASMTSVNRRACQWFLQSKKKGITTYGTSHDVFYLDLRLRQNFDYLIRTSVYPANRPKGVPPSVLKMEWINGPNQKHLHKTMKINLQVRKDLLGMYNTRNHINIFAEKEVYEEKAKADAAIKKAEAKKKVKLSPIAKAIEAKMEEKRLDIKPNFLNYDTSHQWNKENGVRA